MEKRLLTLILLLVFGHSFAQQTNHWTTIIGTQYNLTMSGLISIDNVAQTLVPFVALNAAVAHVPNCSRPRVNMWYA